MSVERHAVFRTVADSPVDSWSSPERGAVTWWEFFSGDTTPTDELTVGLAEVPVGSVAPARGHHHDAAEVYFVVSGRGEVVVDGAATPVGAGTAVWIPADVEHFARNTGDEPLRLLYVFARDRFSDVHYTFPGEIDSSENPGFGQ
jgi:mannose-6-phosphate isomerase-like protein (cupin superfamily)